MDQLPTGAQSSIAQKLGVSKQFVSLVLQGNRQHDGVLQLAVDLAAAYAVKTRVAQFRHYINTLTDEALADYLEASCLSTANPYPGLPRNCDLESHDY